MGEAYEYMYFGACYYPEHWPENRWVKDVQLMKEAHFNVVRMGEFAWAKMEPEENKFDFLWLDRAMELMLDNEIKVILGTPTAGPPKWLMDKHPDVYQKDIYGHTKGFGARRHYCYNNDIFQYYTTAIVTQMTKRYGMDKNVISWQIDNEFGMIDTTRCYCNNCLKAFKEWLKVEYGTIGAVNDAWGTIFSSQTFNNWEAIHLPAYAVHQNHNPGLSLDFMRFSSDSVRKYQKLQLNIIRQYAPHHLITHNEMGKFNQINYFDLSQDLDICSLDVYPNLKNGRDGRPSYSAFQHDVTRGFKKQNYWVLEHQSGTPGGTVMAPTPKPGELRRWTLQSVAHGADAIVYFRWRSLPYSIEEFWHGILQHHGEPGRKFDETKKVGEELKRLYPMLTGTVVHAKVGMIRSYDNEWSFEIQPQINGFEYIKHFETYYRYFHDRNIAVDIISPEMEFNNYDLLIAPNIMMVKPNTVERLYQYVKQGGYLITDFRTGVKEWNNQISTLRLPGVMKELLGIKIEDYGIIEQEIYIKVRHLASQNESKAAYWYDVIELIEAEPVSIFISDYFKGAPAVTRRLYGSGYAYYIGTVLDQEGLKELLDSVCTGLGIKASLPDLPPGVEAFSRKSVDGMEREYIFVINHNEQPAQLMLERGFVNILNGKKLGATIVLDPNDVIVLCKKGLVQAE